MWCVAHCRVAYETANSAVGLVPALLAAGEMDTLRDFTANSLLGAYPVDESVRNPLAAALASSVYGWKSDDGHCHSTMDTWLLMVRGLAALVEEDTETSRAQLREWLPPAAELMRIAEYECYFRAASFGGNHPALLCARLHGERLGAWGATVEVAQGVLAIEQFNPLLRTEALRLLGAAHAAEGRLDAACEACERAVSEAAGARYVWLELLSLRDVLRWSDEGAAAEVRSRLGAVVSRVSASTEELVGVLGEGVLESLPVAGAATPSREVMDAEFGISIVAALESYRLEGVAFYPGPMTKEMLLQSYAIWSNGTSHLVTAAASAPDPTFEILCEGVTTICAMIMPRHHSLPQFSAQAILGESGELARRIVER